MNWFIRWLHRYDLPVLNEEEAAANLRPQVGTVILVPPDKRSNDPALK